MAREGEPKVQQIQRLCGRKSGNTPGSEPCDKFSERPLGCAIDPNLSGVCGQALATGGCNEARVDWVPGRMSQEGFQPK